jgi:Zn-dependent membrane protease YugP
MLGFSLPSMILMGGIMLASWLVSSRLKANLNTIQSCICRTGAGAEKMLADNGIRDVSDFNSGRLNHYNPSDKTVNLSEAVYNQYRRCCCR